MAHQLCLSKEEFLECFTMQNLGQLLRVQIILKICKGLENCFTIENYFDFTPHGKKDVHP